MIAMLIVGSTVFTMPTSPSGATTGLNGVHTATALPAESVRVYSSPTAPLWSASAGTNPQLEPRAEPEQPAQAASFSPRARTTRIACRARLSRPRVSRFAGEPGGAGSARRRCWSATSGATTCVRRSAEANGSRMFVGELDGATIASTTHATKSDRVAAAERAGGAGHA